MNRLDQIHSGVPTADRFAAFLFGPNRLRAKRPGKPLRKPLRFEPLESRVLLSADWQFQLDCNGDTSNNVNCSALDGSQRLYLAGNVRSSMDLDPSEGVSLVDTEGTGGKGFIAVYAPDGSLEWTQRIGSGSGTCGVTSIALGADGSIVATGGFGGSVSLGTDALGNECEFSAAKDSGFVAKYGPDHALNWAVPFVSSWRLGPQSVAVDSCGDVYVTGGLEGVNQFGDFSISEVGPHSAFVAKLGAADGEVLWVKHDMAGGETEGKRVAVDDSGNVCVAGTFHRFAGEGFDLGGQYVVQKGDGDLFVAQLDSATGEVRWTRRLGGTFRDGSNLLGEDVNSLACDGDGNLLLTGYFQRVADFGDYVLSNAGTRDVYIAKLDGGGNVLWAESLGGATAVAYAYGITADPAGGAIVAGSFRGLADMDPGPSAGYADALATSDAYFLKLNDAGSFEQRWHVVGGDAANDNRFASGVSVFSASDGSLYFLGRFRGRIDLPTGTLVNPSTEYANFYVCKFTPAAQENQPPSAADDAYEVYEGHPLRVDRFDGVLVNDSDADLDSLSASIASGPEHGTVVLDLDGGFVYMPDDGFGGVDSFAYRVSDGRGGEAVALATVSAVPPPSVCRYESVSVPIGIGDLRTTGSELVVNDPFRIGDLNVEVNISHTRDADLDVYLVSPQGPRVELFTDVGGRGKGFTSTVLDDDAATPIAAGVAPFTGLYRPEGALSALIGEPLAGRWFLEITDDQLKETGTLTSWALIASPGPPAPQILVSRTAGLETTEAGAIDAFDVCLDMPPTSSVTLGLSSSDLSEGTVTPAALTFTPENWSQPQTVRIAGVDDAVDDGGVNYTIITLPAVSDDARFDGLSAMDVSVLNVDDELPPVTVTISDVSAREGKAGISTIFSFAVTSSGAPVQAFGMDYATVAGTATEGIDYVPRKGSIRLSQYTTSTKIEIEVFGDAVGEANETFSLHLSNPSVNVILAKADGRGTILNDDKLSAGAVAAEAAVAGGSDNEASVLAVPRGEAVDRALAGLLSADAAERDSWSWAMPEGNVRHPSVMDIALLETVYGR